MLLKNPAQQQNRTDHSGRPTNGKSQQIEKSVFPFFPIFTQKIMDGIQKVLVKSQNKGDGSTGDTGNTVRQSHGNTMKNVRNHDFDLLFLPNWVICFSI